MNMLSLLIWTTIFATLIYNLVRSLQLVPQKSAVIVERLGKYHSTLGAGFHILLPFIDQAVGKLSLKEEAIHVPPQEIFTKDEVKVLVDGVIYISVLEPSRSYYGVVNYKYASMQLAQTTTRSIVGTLTLDRTFEERSMISNKVVDVLDQTASEWGIRVHRYEIKNIQPPSSVHNSMEKQVAADREKRAILAQAEGGKQSRINRAEGTRQEMINHSEGQKQKIINEAEGAAAEIRAIADATAASITKIAHNIELPSGKQAIQLQLTEKFIESLRGLKQEKTEIILPADLTSIGSMLEKVGLKK
ncbi:MAG: SPFH domain-containing protein [Oligoflexales bacterium]